MKHLHIYLTLMSFIAVSAWAYGEYLEANAILVSEVPSHFMCQYDTLANHYICYGEQR